MTNNYCIKELPLEDRPREKMLMHGPSVLSNSELLAILIRTGTREKSALKIARELAADELKLRTLAMAKHPQDLSSVKGLGPVKAVTILAALELGRRIAYADAIARDVIETPDDIAAIFMPRLRYEKNEHFMLVLLNTKNKVIGMEQISEGSLNSSVVHPREVFAPAVVQRAAAILVGHNHPSGDPAPSREDRNLTEALVQTGKILGIPLLDHIVIGDGCYFSFKEHGYL